MLGKGDGSGRRGEDYAIVNDILTPCIIVDVDCDASEGGDF